MKVLIVYAHMEPKSFNAALLDTATTALKAQGHDVTLSDLYAQKFNPVISREDTTVTTSKDEHFDYVSQMGAAVLNDTLAEDIKQEQQKVSDADLIIFQFPMQWYSVPAIMKGWLDRVLLTNFAFCAQKFKLYDQALLAGKKAMLSFTTGSMEGFFKPNGVHGDMRVYLTPIHATLRFCGLDLLPPNVCYAPGSASPDERQRMLDQWRKRLDGIFEEPVAEFPKLADGVELPPDFKLPSQSPTEFGPSVAQHMGRKIAPQSIAKI